jgi:membrane peptidoglycan carboxypeptidase
MVAGATGGGVYGVREWIHRGDGEIPANTAEGVPRTRSYACFEEVPNCDDSNALAIYESEGNEIPITLDQMNQSAIDLLIAVEDRNFYEHDGVDDAAIVRAIKDNVEANTVEGIKSLLHRKLPKLSFKSGGSTITMQLVKNKFLSDVPSNEGDRKAWEWEKAVSLEQQYQAEEKQKDPTITDAEAKYRTKQRILNEYFNIVNFGRNARGIEAAARVYFSVSSAKDLTIPQEARLIAAVNDPSFYEGSANEERNTRSVAELKDRSDKAINDLYENGKLPEDQVKPLQDADPGLTPYHKFDYGPATIYNVADTLQARQFLDRIYAEAQAATTAKGYTDKQFRSGLRINTTLSKKAQADLVAAIASTPLKQDGRQAIAVMLRQDGSIMAYYGGYYPLSQVDMLAQPQPLGSATKPLFYAEAHLRGTIKPDYPDPPDFVWPAANGDGSNWVTHGGNHCTDHEHCTEADAVAHSSNPVALQVGVDLGPDGIASTYQHMEALGSHSDNQPEPSGILGYREASVVDTATMYNGFIGNQGISTVTRDINSITVLENGAFVDKGFVAPIPANQQPYVGQQIYPTDITATITEDMRGVVREGTASRLAPLLEETDIADKTGTSGTSEDTTIANVYGIACIQPTDGGPKYNITIGVDLRFLDDLKPLGNDEEGGKTPAIIMGKIIESQVGQPCLING